MIFRTKPSASESVKVLNLKKQIMKTKKSIFLALLAFTLSAGIFTSCKKKEETPAEPEQDTEQATIADNNTAENFVLDIDAMGSELSENSAAFAYKSSS